LVQVPTTTSQSIHQRVTPEAPAEEEPGIEAIVTQEIRKYGRGTPTYEFLTTLKKGLAAPYDTAELIPSAVLQDYCRKNEVEDMDISHERNDGNIPQVVGHNTR
jgi:hypothetical protein